MAAGSFGCQRDLFASGGPHAVGKRTPRIPVSNMFERVNIISSIKRGLRSAVSTADDEVIPVAAWALAEASQRGDSPHDSKTLRSKEDHMRHSLVQSDGRKNLELGMTNAKTVDIHMDGGYLEGSIGSREAENGDLPEMLKALWDLEVTAEQKSIKGRDHSHTGLIMTILMTTGRACSGTEEGLSARKVKDESDMEVTDVKATQFPKGTRNRSRQLFFGGLVEEMKALPSMLCRLW